MRLDVLSRTSTKSARRARQVAVSVATIKRLFARTGNSCAFPGCTERLVNDKGNLIAEVCHICADRVGGRRYDPTQSDEERQSHENLVVLCPNHHAEIDSDDAYTVDQLHKIKSEHEAKSRGDFRIGNSLAQRISDVLSGASAGLIVAEAIHEVGEFIRGIAPSKQLPTEPSEEDRWEAEIPGETISKLIEPLKYSRKGQVYIAEDAGKAIVYFISYLFRRAGWQIVRIERPKHWNHAVPLVFFGTPRPHQFEIIRQAVEEFFSEAGFVKEESNAEDARYSQDSVTLCVGFVVTRASAGSN
jgi:hypothetical protein